MSEIKSLHNLLRFSFIYGQSLPNFFNLQIMVSQSVTHIGHKLHLNVIIRTLRYID